MSSTLPTKMALLVGIALSISATLGVAHIEQLRQQDRFDRKADSLRFVLQRNFDTAFQVTNAVGGFFAFAETITDEKFALFSEQVLQNSPGVLSVGLAEHIPHNDRSDFEASLAQRGAIYPFIWEENHNRVPVLEDYIVTTYLEPLEQRQGILGYNHTSYWQRKLAIDRSQQSKVMSTTTQVRLPESGDSAMEGFVVYQPVYRNNPTDEANFIGFVYSTFHVEDAIAAAIEELDWQDVDFYLYDLDIDRLDSALLKGLDSLDERFSIAYDSHSQAIAANPNATELARINRKVLGRGCPYGQGWTACIRTINLKGREWSGVILPPPTSFGESVWTTLIIGLLLTSVAPISLGWRLL